jgi:hypothetical protein
VQIAIKVLLNYKDPICSARRCALAAHQVVADRMPSHSANNYTFDVMGTLHLGGKMGNKIDS